jgi:hypothetical protein
MNGLINAYDKNALPELQNKGSLANLKPGGRYNKLN